MHTIIRTWRGFVATASAAVLALILATTGLTSDAAGASTPSPTLPQVPSAVAAAQWLTGQMTSGGYIAGSVSETVNTLLALAAANVNLPLAQDRAGLRGAERRRPTSRWTAPTVPDSCPSSS